MSLPRHCLAVSCQCIKKSGTICFYAAFLHSSSFVLVRVITSEGEVSSFTYLSLTTPVELSTISSATFLLNLPNTLTDFFVLPQREHLNCSTSMRMISYAVPVHTSVLSQLWSLKKHINPICYLSLRCVTVMFVLLIPFHLTDFHVSNQADSRSSNLTGFFTKRSSVTPSLRFVKLMFQLGHFFFENPSRMLDRRMRLRVAFMRVLDGFLYFFECFHVCLFYKSFVRHSYCYSQLRYLASNTDTRVS
nr:MAG TPA: hypothetical protein [Caudoviricetes sp.]